VTAPRLLYPGTLVTATLGGYQANGVVERYEHYHPNQSTFPVKFGRQTTIVTAAEVTVLPDDQQPPDRQPPRHTGQFLHHSCGSCEQ
jgi:hypothetical protein